MEILCTTHDCLTSYRYHQHPIAEKVSVLKAILLIPNAIAMSISPLPNALKGTYVRPSVYTSNLPFSCS